MALGGKKYLRKFAKKKSLKNASFWVINPRRLPQTYSSGEKNTLIQYIIDFFRLEKSKETVEDKKNKKDDRLRETYQREERKLFLGGKPFLFFTIQPLLRAWR